MNTKLFVISSWVVGKSANVSKVSMAFELLDNTLSLIVGVDSRILLVVKLISWTLKIVEEMCKVVPYLLYLVSKKKNS